MDNKTQNDTPEYMQNLPQSVQDLIFDAVWEERTLEIAQKYSLNPDQTDTLINTVLFVLIGMEKPDTFLETVIAETGISRLLADQIMEDLDIRVFEYAAKTVENKEKKVSEQKLPVETKENPLSKIPEIRPESFPLIEKGEAVHTNPVPVPKIKIEEKISIPRYVPKISSEPVQRPVPVPRLIATEIPDEELDKTPVVDIRKEDVKPISKYIADPYREPLE